MAQPIGIPIQVTQEGLQYLGQATDALNALGTAGQNTATGTGAATGGLEGLVKGAADAWGAIKTVTASINEAGGMISAVDALGVSSLRTKEALGGISGGQAVQYMDALRSSTHGLVDDMTLASVATKALATGVASTPAQMAKIAEEGSALAMIFQGAADGGANLVQILEQPGMTRGLKQLGIEIEPVKIKFAELKKEGIDAATAWNEAVMGTVDKTFQQLGADIENGPGTAVDRLNTKFANFKQMASERVAIGIDATINLVDVVSQKHPELVQAVLTALAGPSGGLLDMNSYIATHGIGIQTSMQQMGTASLNYGGAQAFRDEAQKITNYRESVEDMRQKLLQQQAQGDPSQASAARSREASVDNGDIWSGIYNSPEGQASMRNSLSGVSNVASGYEPQSDRMALNADATQRAAAAADQLAQRTKESAAAAGQMDGSMQNVYQSFQKVSNTSLAQAFGTTSGGIGGQIEGGLSADIAAQRAALVKKGAGSAELANYDDRTKTYMEQYKVATGQATPESEHFAAALASVDKAASSGTMTIDAAAKKYLELAQAAKEGRTSITDINDVMGWTAPHAGGAAGKPGDTLREDARHGGHAGGTEAVQTPKTADGKSIESMYDPVLNAQKKVQDGNTAIGTTYTAAVPVVAKAAEQHAAALAPAIDRTNALITLQGRLKQSLGSWTGTYTVRLIAAYSPGGGPGGGAGGQGGGVP